MKKKIFSFIFALFFILPCAFILTGCGEESPSQPSQYTITINQNLHGTVGANKTVAEENDTITITTQADEGYDLYAITCDGVVLNSNTFTMPAKNIIISAIFEQKSESPIALTLGNYIQIAGDVYLDGTYLQDITFFNTITVKANNIVDLFVQLNGKPVEVNNISYTQVGQTVSVSVSTFNYTAQIIDSKTILVRDDDRLHLFYYQPDETINNGNYTETYYAGGNRHNINLKFGENKTISITQTTNSESTYEQSGTYCIKGNTVFIQTETLLIFAKISDVTSNSFYVERIRFYDVEDASWSDFEIDSDKYIYFYFRLDSNV